MVSFCGESVQKVGVCGWKGTSVACYPLIEGEQTISRESAVCSFLISYTLIF